MAAYTNITYNIASRLTANTFYYEGQANQAVFAGMQKQPGPHVFDHRCSY